MLEKFRANILNGNISYKMETNEMLTCIIVHSTKLLHFDWLRAVQLIPKLYSVGVPIKFPWKRRNFVECTINKKSHNLEYNSWIIGTRDFGNSQIALP